MSENPLSPLAMIEVGCEIHSAERFWAGGDFPLGGMVVDAVESLDRETGEVSRAWLVLDRAVQPRVLRIEAAEVDPGTILPPSSSNVAGAVRRLCYPVARNPQGRLRRGPLTPADAASVRYAAALVATMFGRS